MGFDGMTWFCPPAESTVQGGVLRVVTGDKGDFWRDTFYGFRHDNGHALLAPAEDEFSAEVTFQGEWQAQYDQAGLYLRASDSHWIKAGVEFVGGQLHLAVVETNGASDWSQMPLPGGTGPISLRLTRVGDAVWVQYRLGEDWAMFRLAPFPKGAAAQVGPMACSPSRAGLAVEFQSFSLTPPVSRQPY